MLEYNEEHRITAEGILEHPWIQGRDSRTKAGNGTIREGDLGDSRSVSSFVSDNMRISGVGGYMD